MRLKHCLNFHDFRRLAKKRLPGPIFNYIDGAADDEPSQGQHQEERQQQDQGQLAESEEAVMARQPEVGD